MLSAALTFLKNRVALLGDFIDERFHELVKGSRVEMFSPRNFLAIFFFR